MKFFGQDAGLGAASGEAQATRIICKDMPSQVPLVAAQLIDLTLSQDPEDPPEHSAQLSCLTQLGPAAPPEGNGSAEGYEGNEGWAAGLTRPLGTRTSRTVLVMSRYLETLGSARHLSNEVLACEMRRMVQALEWVHGKGYVHMDVKVSGGRVFWCSCLPSFSSHLPLFRCLALPCRHYFAALLLG